MAHQWFGDLVTMAWWDDLWLNEGFASWMENKATQHFHPDWGADIDRVGSREGAMGLDSLNSTHPSFSRFAPSSRPTRRSIRSPIRRASPSSQCWRTSPAPDVWRDGIRRYIARTNTRTRATNDLWTRSEAAGARA